MPDASSSDSAPPEPAVSGPGASRPTPRGGASAGDALPAGNTSEELFEALDEIAGIVLTLRDDPDHADKAERLDRAGERIVDALVREFSLKSAQVEILLREMENLEGAWGSHAKEVARRNERLAEDGTDA